MNWLDLIIISLIVGATLTGFKMGLLRATFLVGSLVLGILISAQVAAVLDELLEKIIENQDIRDLVTFSGAFVVIFVGVNIAGSIICKIISFTPLKWIDSWIGSALGFLAGIMFVGVATMYLVKLPVEGTEVLVDKSLLAPMLKALVRPVLRELMEKKESLVALYWTLIA